MPEVAVTWRGEGGHSLAFVLPLLRGRSSFSCEFSLVCLDLLYEGDCVSVWHRFTKWVTSFREKKRKKFEVHTTLGWHWNETEWKTQRKVWGGELVDRHPFAKIGIFLSYLQPSGEAIEQREYIESSRLFFSLGRTVIFSWLRTRVQIWRWLSWTLFHKFT